MHLGVGLLHGFIDLPSCQSCKLSLTGKLKQTPSSMQVYQQNAPRREHCTELQCSA